MFALLPWFAGGHGGPSQRGPALVDPLLFDAADFLLAHAEALGDELPRLGDRRAAVLGLHQGQEDFFAAQLRLRPLRLVSHGRLLGKALPIVVAGARVAFSGAHCSRARSIIVEY